MLKYDKLFVLLKKRGINRSSLRDMGFSPNLVGRLSRGEHMNTVNVDKLCALLDCQPGDIMEYVPDENMDK